MIVDLMGKGRHIRSVPVPDWVKAAIEVWMASAGITKGRLFRCVCRAGKIWGDGITEKVVWHVVKYCAKGAAIERLAPMIFVAPVRSSVIPAGGELEQIQFLLGARFRPDD